MGRFLLLLLTAFAVVAHAEPSFFEENIERLFRDLDLVAEVDKELNDHLPYLYNNAMVVGYWNMPSARMNKPGTMALGFGFVPPYRMYGANIQLYSHLEFVGNYRIFKGVTEANFGKEGFGDDADRGMSVKVGLLQPSDGLMQMPCFAVGLDDFHGSSRFHSFYIVMTKEWLAQHLEVTLGWGKGRIKGFFGGLAWTPLRGRHSLSFFMEYDAINYKKHPYEHASGRKVSSRINMGVAAEFFDAVQLKVGSLRGRKVEASVSAHYNFGTSLGFFPKTKNPPFFTEKVSARDGERALSKELSKVFCEQGFTLYQVFVTYDAKKRKILWMKVLNLRYREERVVRERIQYLLAALIPRDIYQTTVVMEVNGVPVQEYRFQTGDLKRLQENQISLYEMATLAPLRDPSFPPSIYDGVEVYHAKKEPYTFTLRPRLLTFFGSTKGKFKYSLGLLSGVEGTLFDAVYYKLLLSYAIKSSFSDVGDRDRLNPSQLINVRSDMIRYFKTNSVSFEQAYLQKGWNLSKGWFGRAALGYFEPMYGGVAVEALYFPIWANWAIGFEFATVWKRTPRGLGLEQKIRKLHNVTPSFVPFVGLQGFLDFYYDFRPLQTDIKVSVGQFLAKDKGVRLEVGKYFPSGFRFSAWYTWTSARDEVNGRNYHDKGISFLIPFDFFLHKSSRTYVGYAMSAWLRDVGARAATGKTTLSDSP